MYDSVSRREFLKAALLAGTSVPVAGGFVPQILPAAESKSPNEKLNIAAIGVRGKGASNIAGVKTENIVALCDIDAARLAEAAKDFPKAQTFDDFRRVLDLKNLDAVVVSTPDHMHAIPVVQAMRRGLAVYCEKPLAHSVHEIRVMREVAKENNIVTQMGTQIHAGDNYRRVVEIIQAGVIGPVRRVHVWQSNTVPPGQRVKEGKVPEGINYDVWLGPAPYRPFHISHFHFNWRFWWDFGGGNLADMGCHYIDLPYWALGLRYPTTVSAKGEKGHGGDNEVPNYLQADYHFPARGDQPPVHLTWYQGGWRPEGAEQYERNSAVLFEGDHGRLVADYRTHKVFLQEGKTAEPVEQTIPASIGHHQEWVHAVKTGGPTTCNFDYSGALAETVLLGNVSYRVGGKTLEWDPENLKAKNCPEADQYIRREYRKGWTL